MKKKSKIILVSVGAFLGLGLVSSYFIDWPVELNKADGDIAKAARFSRQEAEPISNMQEMLQNDSTYKDGIVLSYVVMQTRAQQFDALVEMTNGAVGDIKEFGDVLAKMNEAREMIGNACKQLKAAGDDLDAVLASENRPNVEQNIINASLAYTTLQKQNQLADNFIETADSYLKQNSGSDLLKLVRDSWMDYQQMTAALDGDEKAAEELEKKGYQLTTEQNLAALANTNLAARYQEAIAMGAELANAFAGIPSRNSEEMGGGNNYSVVLGAPRKNSEMLGAPRKNSEILGIHVIQSFNNTLGAIKSSASALNAQEALAIHRNTCIGISGVISATALGNLPNSTVLGSIPNR